MPKYKVTLKGFADASEAGTRSFLTKFGQAYKMDPEQARSWIKQARMVLYRFDRREDAEKSKTYLEGLGAIAEVQEEEASPPAAAPAAAPPASPPSAPVPPAGPAPGPPGRPAPAAPLHAGAPPGSVGAALVGGAAGAGAALVGGAAGAPGAFPPAYAAPYQYALPPKIYIRSYTFEGIFSDTFDLFFKHFWPLVQVSVIPTLPLALTGLVVGFLQFGTMFMPQNLGADPSQIIGMIGAMAVPIVLLIALSIYLVPYSHIATITAINQLLLGKSFQPIELLKQVDKIAPFKYLATMIPVWALFVFLYVPLGGFVILIVLGAQDKDQAMIISGVAGAVISMLASIPAYVYIFSIFMFSLQALAIENVWLMDGLSRSAQLSRGYRWRNVFIRILIGFVIAMPMLFISICASNVPLLGMGLSQIVQAAIYPAGAICVTLLYYDMRVKKGEIASQAPPSAYPPY